ncbi:MAG TPA: response regulator [Thermodesulfatator atlanticus]|uniref:Response regulator n=1 Tax=Thermodesulfatator atlanticus TaxID=501497 RepID=A0A7V5U2J2_9BACT|nr:response regulator [Thermodesulfatator atlanticus]
MSEEREQIRILIAEDERAFRILLSEELQDENREVKAVANGLEALDLLKKEEFDILITDLKMPEMGGIELLKEARKIRPDLLVIVITGYASLETAILALKEGAYDYIRKPFSLEELKVSVNNACTKIFLERENKRLLEDLKKAYERLKEVVASKEQTGPEDLLGALERLAQLRREGFLDEEEFEAVKQILIERAHYG